MRGALLLAVLSVCLFPGPAWGRAGGGDSFSGSSSRSSYSGSSTSGSSYSGSSSRSYSTSRSRSTGRYAPGDPAGLLPFLLAGIAGVVILIVRLGSGAFGTFDDCVCRGRARDVEAVSTASLSDRDGSFDRREFLRFAALVFGRVQDAWSGGSMAPVAAFVSDGVVERFETLLAMQRLEGRVNEVSEISVEGAEFVSVLATDAADRVTVRLSARCRDVYRGPDGTVLSDRRDSFEEDWTFLRSAGARGSSAPGPSEGNCPKCGAGVTAGRAALCAHCRTWLNTGEHGWVLCEISQPSVWRLASRTAGWAFDGQDDAHPALLEDQAAVFFWWVVAAMARGDATALAGVVDPALHARLAEDARSPVAPVECGVGEVTLTGSRREGGWAYADFEVLWSGVPRRRDTGERGPSNRLVTHLSLRRPEAARRPFAAGLRAAHCSGCGAPSEPGRLSCAQCGRERGAASGDWTLADFSIRPWG